jgi:anaerobic selenocysteine-containing dehydrogenase
MQNDDSMDLLETGESTCSSTGQSRREFLCAGGLVFGAAFLGSHFLSASQAVAGEAGANVTQAGVSVDNPIHTVCLQCNTGCGIKVSVNKGVATKIEGNPYSPWTMVPALPYATPLAEANPIQGALCPKGQAGLETAYDPYRIVKVLKRAGGRGENKWITIPFDQAASEVVEGGKLFKSVKGEEQREVTGLREIWALRDKKVAADMATAVDDIRKKKPEERAAAIAEFKTKFAADLDKLIDPDHPDFGPKNNQLVFAWGRLKAGRSELIKRFVQESFGSANAHGHTTVCQGSLYFTGKAMSDQFTEGKFTGGSKAYWQADTSDVEFLLAIGSAYMEGGYGPTHHARKLMKNLVDGKLKIAVVDPRFSKIASKAWKWVPIKPGTDGALALAMIRWILENDKHDKKFLGATNKAAATAAGEPTWTNAAWLVKDDGKFLRASEIGLAEKETRATASGGTWVFDAFVAMKDGAPVALDPNDASKAVVGDTLYAGTVGGKAVKTVLQTVLDTAKQKTVDEWAAICGIAGADIVELAQEFTSYGKKAVADPHRGVAQHTNGFYNVLAVYTLNALIGNWDHRGGLLKLTTYTVDGTKDNQPFALSKLHPTALKPFGISSIRHDTKYEDSTIFAGYPAKRPWYPFASDVYEEIVPSIGDAYPYPVKALITYMAAAPYSLPGGQTNIEILSNVDKLPLYIANDIGIGEMSMYADYIFPDVSYLERWEFHGSHPSIGEKVQPVRNPAIAPLTDDVTVYGEKQPSSLEAMLLGFAEKLGLPGFGPDGFGTGLALTRGDDFYLRMVANLAAGDKAGDEAPDADDAELATFLDARKHLPATVFDAARWQQIVGDTLWRKVVYILNRGGRFQDVEKAFTGDVFNNKYGKLLNLYVEKAVSTKSAITGKAFLPTAAYLPIRNVQDQAVDDSIDGYDLSLITFRDILMTKSRTIADYWLTAILPENAIVLGAQDAAGLGLKTGDSVRVTSKSNPSGEWDLGAAGTKPMVGKVKVVQGMRPGVVGFCLGYGHWANGAGNVTVNGRLIKGDKRRATGVHVNAAMRLDDYLKNTCMLDPVGGSVSFYDTKVKLVKQS